MLKFSSPFANKLAYKVSMPQTLRSAINTSQHFLPDSGLGKVTLSILTDGGMTQGQNMECNPAAP